MYYQAGGNIAMGTDAGTPFNQHGANAMELEFMADLGVKSIAGQAAPRPVTPAASGGMGQK
jgi:imidazolonepropionase-like amidohydrolase